MDLASNRIPALDGALNFRDLGGYAAADGRTVRWNAVFRSGTTHALTPEDISALAKRGIRYAFDLRSNKERCDYPSRLTDITGLTFRYRDHDDMPGDIRRVLHSPDATAEDSRQLMISVYRELPHGFADAIRSLFAHLAEGEFPLVFNCAAGKDRTGVAAALLLSALGVPRATVVEDYLLTDQFFQRSCDMILGDKRAPLFANLDRAVWEPLMRVHADYLNAMFSELEQTHGSLAGYFNAIGIDSTIIHRMRDQLLE
jgi:protein-tyrosine phosphatase